MTHVRAGSLALLCALLPAACGVRGDPLPPRLIVPAPVVDLSARRYGDQVYVEFTIPSADSDSASPADLDRIELYARTARPADDGTDRAFDDWMDAAALVATLEVGAPQAPGERVTVVEPLTPAAMVPAAVDADDHAGEVRPGADGLPAGPLPGSPPLLGPPPLRRLARTYVALAVSSRGRVSRPSPPGTVPLGPAPAPPAALRLTHDVQRLALTWSPPAAARRPVQRPADAGQLVSRALPPPPTATRYEVYAAAAADAGRAGVPRPLHAAPLAETAYREAQPALGVERCFVVRTVDEIDGFDVRSAPSEVACRELVDTFAPAAPAGLAAVAAAGAVNLAWTPNAEDDVAGYLVLRGRGAGATLGALTAAPIAATTYRDATVEAGVSYEYAVQAVDDAVPPNVSPPSERVREQAR